MLQSWSLCYHGTDGAEETHILIGAHVPSFHLPIVQICKTCLIITIVSVASLIKDCISCSFDHSSFTRNREYWQTWTVHEILSQPELVTLQTAALDFCCLKDLYPGSTIPQNTTTSIVSVSLSKLSALQPDTSHTVPITS